MLEVYSGRLKPALLQSPGVFWHGSRSSGSYCSSPFHLSGYSPKNLFRAKDWPNVGRDQGGNRHSPLTQINRSNVSKLEVAWTFDTEDWSDGSNLPSRSAFEATPLVIDGVMYIPSPMSRLFALNAETGEKLWVFDSGFDRKVRRNLYVNRGVSTWTDGKKRLLYLGDIQGRLWAVDAKTGKLDPAFGDAGKLDLRAGMADGFPQLQYGLTSPTSVCGDVVVAGSMVSDGQPRGPNGDVRGFDARNGKELWRFHTVPRDGEPGSETWEPGSRKDRGGLNVWSFMTVDEARSLVFLPLTSPSYDVYGGDRKGANLFGDSVVALDCKSGKMRWYYQTLHHDLWDYDLPAAPVLAEVKRDGKTIPAVAQVTKQGFVFVLDRETGKPLYPVEERPVPKSTLPGEESSPTQPYPVVTPPIARQSMTAAELTNVTPESRAECLANTQGAKLDVKVFDTLGEQDQALFPGLNGGPDYGGASFDGKEGPAVRQLHGCRRTLSHGETQGRVDDTVCVEGHEVRVLHGQGWLSLPATALGVALRHRPQHWRHSLALHTGRIRRIEAAWDPQDGHAQYWRLHGHGRRPGFHRGHQRPEVPRFQ